MTNEDAVKEAVSFFNDSLNIAIDIIDNHLDIKDVAEDVRAAMAVHTKVLEQAGLLPAPGSAEHCLVKGAPHPPSVSSVAEAVEKLNSASSQDFPG